MHRCVYSISRRYRAELRANVIDGIIDRKISRGEAFSYSSWGGDAIDTKRAPISTVEIPADSTVTTL